MKWEIDYYNIYFYDEYEFLRQALELKQYYYFWALLDKPDSIPDNENIHSLLRSYG